MLSPTFRRTLLRNKHQDGLRSAGSLRQMHELLVGRGGRFGNITVSWPERLSPGGFRLRERRDPEGNAVSNRAEVQRAALRVAFAALLIAFFVACTALCMYVLSLITSGQS